MTVYYNDSDPFVCAWLRNLIAAKLLPAGDVDERPIEHVQASDVAGYTQCHFFAGIGGWPHALQLAEWGDRPVWTGSCPCQPVSGAGQRKGHADRRHLWPAFYRLITECRPPVVFGEQVAGKLGREWFAGVRADLEAVGYACGAADLCAPVVGARHIRARLFFVADAFGERQQGTEAWQSGTDAQRDMAPRRAEWLAKRNAVIPSPESPWPVGPCCVGKLPTLDDGLSEGLGQLRATGNAIVPQLAASFVNCYLGVVAGCAPRPHE